MIDRYEWTNRVGFHPAATHDVQEKHEYFRELVHRLGLEILAHIPRSREQELALEDLEKALMWTNKAIAVRESPLENQWKQKAAAFDASG